MIAAARRTPAANLLSASGSRFAGVFRSRRSRRKDPAGAFCIDTQNRDGGAVQAKLDELIRAGAAHNTFIGIEHLTDEEIEGFRSACALAAERAAKKKGRTNPKTR